MKYLSVTLLTILMSVSAFAADRTQDEMAALFDENCTLLDFFGFPIDEGLTVDCEDRIIQGFIALDALEFPVYVDIQGGSEAITYQGSIRVPTTQPIYDYLTDIGVEGVGVDAGKSGYVMFFDDQASCDAYYENIVYEDFYNDAFTFIWDFYGSDVYVDGVVGMGRIGANGVLGSIDNYIGTKWDRTGVVLLVQAEYFNQGCRTPETIDLYLGNNGPKSLVTWEYLSHLGIQDTSNFDQTYALPLSVKNK